jgi:hypothetical protein
LTNEPAIDESPPPSRPAAKPATRSGDENQPAGDANDSADDENPPVDADAITGKESNDENP